MSLRNDSSNNLVWSVNEPLSEVLFAESERRLSTKKQIIVDMQNEYNLLEMQALNLYKDHVVYWTFGENLFKATNKWLTMVKDGKDSNGEKLDKRKKYEEKSIYEYFTDHLKNLLGVDDLVITGIMYYGYASEGYYVIFTSHDKKWQLFVPDPGNVTMQTFRYSGEDIFKLKLDEYLSDHHTRMVGATFREEDLKEIMEKALGGENK